MNIVRGILSALAVLCVSVVDAESAYAQPTNWFVRTANAAREQFSTSRPRIVRRSIELEDASLETLKSRLRWIGIDIPFEMTGDVTASLGVEVDLVSLNDAKSYRINGSLSSSQLTVEGLTLRDLSAIARYVDGSLSLQQLVATVPDPRMGEPAGLMSGDAQMQLLPVGKLTASLKLDGVPLEQFRRRIEALSSLTGGRLTGRLATEAPVPTIRDIRTWRGNGQLDVTGLVAAGRNVSKLETAVQLENGTLTLSDASARLEGQHLQGSGSLGLVTPFRFDGGMQLPSGKLSRLGPLLGRTLPARWSGDYEANVKASGTLRPFQLDATASLAGRDWLVADVPVSHVSANVTSDGTTLTLTQLDVEAAGGNVTGTASIALQESYKYDAELAVEDIKLSQSQTLARMLDPTLTLGGTASGQFTSSGTLSPRSISAAGELRIRDLQLNGQTFAEATIRGELSPKAIELQSLALVAEDSRVTGTGRIELTGGHGFSLQFTPERFELATLQPVISVALWERSAVQQTVAYRGSQDETGDPEAAPPGIAGTASGTIDAVGDLRPFKLDALDGSLEFDGLTIGGVTFDRAEIVAKTADNTINLSRVFLTRGEGKIEGEGSLGLAAPGAFSMSMRTTNFAIDQSSPLFGEQVRLPVNLPPISGAMNGELSVAGETQPLRLLDAKGTLAGDDIRIGQLLVDQFEVNVATAEDVINVNDFLLVIDDGRLSGDAAIGLKGQQSFEATLRPDGFRIELLQPLFGDDGLIESDFPPVAGRLSGEMTVKGRLSPAGIDAVSGTIHSENGRASGVPFQRASIVVASENGAARIRELTALSDFGSLHGTGSVGLSAPYRYAANLSFSDFDLSAIGDVTAAITEEQRPDIDSPAEVAPGPGVLPVELEGLASVDGAIEGTGVPFVLTGSGRGGADQLVLNANELSTIFRRTTLTKPSFHWKYNERQLTLSDIAAGLGGGTLNGTVVVPLGDLATGSLNLNVIDMAIADLIELPVRIDGVTSGTIVATLSAVDSDGERNADGNAQLSIPSLRVGRVEAGDVEASVGFRNDIFRYDVTGNLFDGPLAAAGTLALAPAGREASAGHFQWSAGDLSRVAAAFSDDPALAGRIDVQLDYDLSAATKATGQIEVSEVRHGTMFLTDRFDARLLWTDNALRIENGAGGYAGGTVALTADLNPLDYARGRVEILLRRADAQRAVGWIPGLAPLEGTLDVRLRGGLSNLWSWHADAELGRGSYGPLAFSSARVPLTIDVNPFRGVMHVEAHRASLRAAHGNGNMNFSADMGYVTRLELDASFTNLDAGEMLDSDGIGGRLAGGRVSGSMQLSSRNFRTIEDLDGSFLATFEGSRAQDLPVIGSVFDVAKLPTGGGGKVKRGNLRIFIRRGVARIDEISIGGAAFRLYAEGTVALSSQRLALDVVADTSPSRTDRIIAGILLRQAIEYATPVGWIERANRLIAERAIYLRVTGTVGRPVVRIRPFQQLGHEGTRFFLNEFVAPVGGNTPVTTR